MEYLRGLRKLRDDPEWLSKLGFGSLLLFSAAIIPFVGRISLAGWCAVIVRRAVAGQDDRLPRLDLDFDYIGKLFGTGFKGFLVALIWGLPAGVAIFAMVMLGYFGMAFGVVAAGRAGGEEAALGVMCCFGAGIPALFLLATLLGLPAQMAMVRAELADDMGKGLELGAVLDMTRKVFRELLIGSIVLSIVQTVMLFVGLLLCYFPVFPAMVAMQVARAYFGAQLYQLYVERGGEPVTIGPLELDPRAMSRAQQPF